jgi:hypothetical protein
MWFFQMGLAISAKPSQPSNLMFISLTPIHIECLPTILLQTYSELQAPRRLACADKSWQFHGLPLGLDEMLVARWLARFMVSSARLGSARLNFFTSWADILAQFVNEPARFVNEPARELNELPYSSKTKIYAYHLQNNWWTCYIYVRCLWPMN